MLRTLVTFFSCWLLCFSAESTTYYLSNSGNDAASGTSTLSPWKTIGKVNTVNFAGGDTLLFKGGQTFTGSIYFDVNDANNAALPVFISSYGNSKATIYAGSSFGFYAYNTKGFTISNLIFEGSGYATNNGDGICIYTDLPGDVKLNRVTFKNLVIRKFGKSGLTIGAYNGNTGFKDVLVDSLHVHHTKTVGITSWAYTSSTHIGWAHENIIVRNSEVNNVVGYPDSAKHQGSGIILGMVNNGLIEKCSAHDNGYANANCGGPGGIWTYDSNSITIQYCESFRNSSGTGCDGLGFDLDGGVTNSTVQYNYSHNNDGAGFLLGQYEYARPWANNTVRYNISENDGRTNGGGITLFKLQGTTMKGAKIYNNTVYFSPTVSNQQPGAFTIADITTGIDSTEVYNNIFYTSGNVPQVDVPPNYSAYFAGNLYWNSNGNFNVKYQGSTYTSLSLWSASTGNEKVGTVYTGLFADPLLLNVGNASTVLPNASSLLNAYQTSTSSPCIDAGLDLPTLFNTSVGNQDYFNNSIPFGNGVDIGAYESHSVTTPTLSEVGLAELNTDGAQLYPNPVVLNEMVFLRNFESYKNIEIYTLDGALTKSFPAGMSSLPLHSPDFCSGLYIVKITFTSGKRKVIKLIIR